MTDPVSYRAMRRLSVDGVVVFANCAPLDSGHAFDRVFDADVGTFCDLWGDISGGDVKIGVDFGEASNYVGYVRAYPRRDEWFHRMIGMTLYGGNRDAEAETSAQTKEGADALSSALSPIRSYTWNFLKASDISKSMTAYRTYFVSDMTEGGGGNIAELEFYGWSKSDLPKPFYVIIR